MGADGLTPRFILVALALGALGGCVAAPPAEPQPLPTTPTTAAPVSYDALEFQTELGAILVLLYPEAAPKTVDLMRTYVAEEYYVGREFTRVVPGHVIQVTDRAGGASDDMRTVPLETSMDHHFSAGAAGIARGTDPNSGGPEFFLMDYATSHLDGNFTVWGQAVAGLDVIHAIARMPALDSSQTPLPSDARTFDRMAIDPVAIQSARRMTLEWPAEDAGRFPYEVAKNVRVGDFRHSLEWPRSLAAGHAWNLTWYVRPYSETALPPVDHVRVDGADLAVSPHPAYDGIYHWTWTPTRPGLHNATLMSKGEGLATLLIDVRA